MELSEANGYDVVMVAVDTLGKRAHFIETHTTITASGAMQLYLNHIWKLHGLPEGMVSDHGPQFVAEFMHELYHLLDIRMASLTAYHPQTDGQTERVNQAYASSFQSDRTIGMSFSRLVSSNTTIMFTPQCRLFHSSLTTEDFHTWGSSHVRS
jgi:hypothetical protein